MRILVIGPNYFNYPDSAAWALTQLGHEVRQCLCGGFGPGQPRWKRKLHKWGVKKFERDHYSNWEARLLDLGTEFHPDLCLIMNGDWISIAALQHLRDLGSRMTLWMIDSISRMPRNESKLAYYDKIFSFDHRDDGYIKEKFGIDCRYCPVGYDPRVYSPQENVTKDFDVSFVGVAVAKRVSLLREVAAHAEKKGIRLAAFGHYWDSRYSWKAGRFARRHHPLQNFVHNRYLPPAEVADVYRRSKICLNIHIPDHEGVNPRTFEILGTRSFQLTDRKPKLRELLRDGIDLVVYDDLEDLFLKIDHYLHADQERESIASQGHQYAAAHYSILESVRQILNTHTLDH